MKAHQIFFCILTLLFLGCNNPSDNKDSVKVADSANEARSDSNEVSDGKAPIITDEESAKFIVRALDGGMMEVALANYVSQKTTNSRVKDFAAMMITDHGKGNNELRDLATPRTVTLPQGTSDEKTKMIKDISAKEGIELDKNYISMMVEDHQKDIKEFEAAYKNSKDSAIQNFIQKTLPVLQKHLDSCTAISKSLK